MRYKCVKFQLAILTNKLFMVKGIQFEGVSPIPFTINNLFVKIAS